MTVLKLKAKGLDLMAMISSGPTIEVQSQTDLNSVALLLRRPIIIGHSGKEYVFDGKAVYMYQPAVVEGAALNKTALEKRETEGKPQ